MRKFTGGGSYHDKDGIPYNVGRENFGSVSMGGDLRTYLKKLQDRIMELENKNEPIIIEEEQINTKCNFCERSTNDLNRWGYCNDIQKCDQASRYK